MAEAPVTTVRDEVAAAVVCGLLRAEGIACGYRYAPDSVFGSEVVEGALGGRQVVIVDETDLGRARELVEAGPLEAACVGCGRPIGADGRWDVSDDGELTPYCAGCAERELGPET